MNQTNYFNGLRKIDAEVMNILQRCRTEGSNLYLPNEQLPRNLYQRVDEVLRDLGGHWVGRKTKAHVFDAENPDDLLDAVLSTGCYTSSKDYDFFWTGENEANRVIELAEIQPSMRILEPSAGRGALALPAAQAAGNLSFVTCIELMGRNADVLHKLGFPTVYRRDFLEIEPDPIYDRVVMNPPFSKQNDIRHIRHAMNFLKPDGRLVAISSVGWEQRMNSRLADEFRNLMHEVNADIQKIAAGAFSHAGTQVATRIITMDAVNFPWYADSEKETYARPRC